MFKLYLFCPTLSIFIFSSFMSSFHPILLSLNLGWVLGLLFHDSFSLLFSFLGCTLDHMCLMQTRFVFFNWTVMLSTSYRSDNSWYLTIIINTNMQGRGHHFRSEGDRNVINVIYNCNKHTHTHTHTPLCENPAKVVFCDLLFSTKQIFLHMVKNILWKCNLYIFNIDWVRSCQRLKL